MNLLSRNSMRKKMDKPDRVLLKNHIEELIWDCFGRGFNKPPKRSDAVRKSFKDLAEEIVRINPELR